MEPIHVVSGLLVLLFLADVVLIWRWNRTYFTIGVPLFIRRVPRPDGIADLPLDELAAQTKNFLIPPMLFRRLDPDAIAFHERWGRRLLVALGEHVVAYLWFVVGLFGLLYFLQAMRYNKVAKQLAVTSR